MFHLGFLRIYKNDHLNINWTGLTLKQWEYFNLDYIWHNLQFTSSDTLLISLLVFGIITFSVFVHSLDSLIKLDEHSILSFSSSNLRACSLGHDQMLEDHLKSKDVDHSSLVSLVPVLLLTKFFFNKFLYYLNYFIYNARYRIHWIQRFREVNNSLDKNRHIIQSTNTLISTIEKNLSKQYWQWSEIKNILKIYQ